MFHKNFFKTCGSILDLTQYLNLKGHVGFTAFGCIMHDWVTESFICKYLYMEICMCKYLYVMCKEIQPVHPRGDQSWVFIGGTDAEAGTPIF